MSSKLKVNNIIPSTGTQIGISTTGGGINLLTGTVVTGIITASGFDGPITQSGDFTIDDYIVHAGDTDTKLGFPAADQIQLDTGGTNYLKLHRYSSVNFVEVGASAQLSLADNGANTRSIVIGDGNASSTGKLFLQAGGGSSGFGGGITMYSHANSTNAGGVYIGKSTNSAGSIIFGNGGTSASPEYMRIDSSGRVQIGISTTANAHGSFDDLIIQAAGGANAGITIVTGTTNQATIAFSDGTSGTARYNGYIQYSNNGDILGFGAGGDDRVTIDGNGKVICKAKDQTVGTLDIWGGNTSVSAVDEINAQIRFRSKDTSVSNTDAVGGTIRSITEYSNGAYTGLSFETFRQDRTPKLREALRLDYNGHVKVTHGNLVIGTAGQGISFINAADTATGETVSSSVLDEYEEGTWIPTTVTGTWGLVSARYTKIGNQVHVIAYMYGCNTTSGSNPVRVNNLPFAPVAGMEGGTLQSQGCNAFSGVYINGTPYAAFYQNDGSSATHYMEHSDISAGGSTGTLHWQATYFTAS